MKSQTTNILRLANTIRQNIQIEKLVNSNNLLITFSGGQDSAFCLLVLYLLNNQVRKQWNCKKVLDLSDHFNKDNTLIKQTFNSKSNKNKVIKEKSEQAPYRLQKLRFCNTVPITLKKPTLFFTYPCSNLSLSSYTHGNGKQNIFYLSQTKALLYRDLIPATSLYCNNNANFLTSINELTKPSFVKPFSKKEKANVNQNYAFVKKKKLIYNQITELIDTYTLLWCNHFWQKDTFFTMEHVFKLSFSKIYTMHSFAPVEKVLSEQNARHWRHKVMQRLSLFLLKRDSHFVELYFNYVFPTTPFLSTVSKKQSKSLRKTFFCKEHDKQSQPLGRSKILNKEVREATLLPVKNFAPTQLCVQGHNKSDRAEAILFNLIRGTGMNGLSTLQWKHTFFPPSNSNSKFYPIFSDFFKERQIIKLNSLFMPYKNEVIKKNKLQKLLTLQKQVKLFYYQLKYKKKI